MQRLALMEYDDGDTARTIREIWQRVLEDDSVRTEH